MELAAGALIAGKYRLERPLATGGMGALWIGRHMALDVPVALKFMDPTHAASTVSRARFEREAKASASLRNQHVVHVLDYGLEGGTPYLVMELLLGEDLRKRLSRERRIPLSMASRILMQTAKGLRTAHEAGVVHRDLKPANIFLAREEGDDEEVVKVLDFGIAKETLAEAVGESTRTGELMGSPHYMSPEQVRGAQDIDHRSDLWSLSVIVFRSLTGQLPFTGNVIGAVIGAILADPIPVASRIAPDLPPGVDRFFERGFARNRDERFQTAREMADAFAAVVAAAGPAAEDPRLALNDEPPTKLQLASRYPVELAADVLSAMPPPASADPASVPTQSMVADSLMAGTTGAPASGALGGTGGPVMNTARPPPPARSRLARGLPAAGILAGVLVTVTAVLALRSPGHDAPAGPGAGTAAPAVTPAPAPASATAIAIAAPTPSAAASAEPAAAAPSASATVHPTTWSKPAARPASAQTAKPAGNAGATKQPNWGF